MKCIGFAPMWNSIGKKDATGAFQPEAKAWRQNRRDAGHECEIMLVDTEATKNDMRLSIIDKIIKFKPDHVAFFCHGWRTGIQFGFSTANIDGLVNALVNGEKKETCNRIVTIYGCLTGSGPGFGEGSFSDRLRDLMTVVCNAVTVDAHTTAGHATFNPHVMRFSENKTVGGDWLIEPGSDVWKKWVRALRSSDLRFEFPVMTSVKAALNHSETIS